MSQGVEWAVHALLLLAPLGRERGLRIAALAQFHDLPQAYMAKQMQLLSKAGIVRTSRGKTGGYSLARHPAEVTLLEVVRAIDGTEPAFRCHEIRQCGPFPTSPEQCRKACPIHAAFIEAERAWSDVLSQTSLADLLGKVELGDAGRIAGVTAWYRENVTLLPDPA